MQVGQAASYYSTISNATQAVTASNPSALASAQKKPQDEFAQIGSEAKTPQQSAPQPTTGSRRGSYVNLVV